MNEFKQQRIVITGGAGSLAKAVIETFNSKIYQVHAPDRYQLDVRKPKMVIEYFSQDPIDLLICNAGITQDELLLKIKDEQWNNVWDVNYSGAVYCAEAVIPQMKSNQIGHIIFISSFSALHPPIGQSAYATAKSALIGLTKDLAVRHGSNNIRVNAILPGFMETRMTNKMTEKRKLQVKNEHCLGRYNTSSEVSKFIRFLHENLTHTSGQVFQLDSRLDIW